MASLGSAYLGPACLLVWLVAGAIAVILALNFAEAAALVPRVGGSFAYAREAWGDFAGFMVGWSLWIAEIAARLDDKSTLLVYDVLKVACCVIGNKRCYRHSLPHT